jgi:hypothetical protein
MDGKWVVVLRDALGCGKSAAGSRGGVGGASVDQIGLMGRIALNQAKSREIKVNQTKSNLLKAKVRLGIGQLDNESLRRDGI